MAANYTRFQVFAIKTERFLKHLWDKWPESIVLGAYTFSVMPWLTVYRIYYDYKPRRRWITEYKREYTVWRPDDPMVSYMQPPEHYPGNDISVRDNYNYGILGMKKDYQYNDKW